MQRAPLKLQIDKFIKLKTQKFFKLENIISIIAMQLTVLPCNKNKVEGTIFCHRLHDTPKEEAVRCAPGAPALLTHHVRFFDVSPNISTAGGKKPKRGKKHKFAFMLYHWSHTLSRTHIDVSAWFVLHQLSHDILARFPGSRRNFGVILPVPAGGVRVQGGGRAMGDPRVRHHPRGFS
jgi:hypothetical protein